MVAVIITPIFLGQLSLIVSTTSTSPVIFIGSALFTLMTVFISTRKPAKEAGKVSPIEALKTSEVEENRKRKTKKSTRGNLIKMAVSNVLRNRKKSAIVTLSLSLSLIILNCAYSIANSFDMDSYIDLNINTDFAVADSAYFNNYIGYNGEATLTDDFLKEISSKEGVSAIGNIRFEHFNYKIDDLLKKRVIDILTSYKEQFRKEELEEVNNALDYGEMNIQIYGMDSFGLDKLNIMQGEINEEKLNSGKYIIVSPFLAENGDVFYNVGDKITVNYEEGSKEYEVMAVAELPYNLSLRRSDILNINFILPNSEFLSHFSENKSPMLTIINCNDEYKTVMESYLKDYCENINPHMDYVSRSTYEQEFKNTQESYIKIGIILSFIIGFIGIMNLINTMTASIISRANELAIIESIGMTKKQIKKMLSFEGLTYVMLTAIFVLTVGLGLCVGLVYVVAGGIWFFKFRFSLMPLIICIPIFFILGGIIPVICYKCTSKASIVERLRESMD